jgi:hypothetical protein
MKARPGGGMKRKHLPLPIKEKKRKKSPTCVISKDGFFSTPTELGMPWGLSFRTLPDDTLEGPVVAMRHIGLWYPLGSALKQNISCSTVTTTPAAPGFLDSVG